MGKKKGVNRRTLILASICCLCCSLLWFSSAEARKAVVRFDGSTMSADIKNITLNDVFKKIQKQRGFWVKGDSSVLESKISIHFDNLSFQDGLKKILGRIDHILLFGRNKEPSGVIIVGGGGARKAISGKDSDRKVRREAPNKRRSDVSGDADDEMDGMFPYPSLTPPTEAELASMKMIESVPMPSGPVAFTEQEMESFKLDKSGNFPESVVTVTPEELELMNPASRGGMMP